MTETNNLQVELQHYTEGVPNSEYDYDRIIYDIDSHIDLLSSQADKYDYLVSIGSGILCGLLDILWVGSFDLERGRNIASKEINGFVTKTARLIGYKKDDLEGAVRFLERKFPIPSDANIKDYGSLQHHLRDFSHHPTIVGLIFSLLTQFTYKAYGTDSKGVFMIVDVVEGSKTFIGNDVPTKILFGTITWFFHLVSDVAGSSSSTGKSGGTGIPGPLLALAKELSVLPIFRDMNVNTNSLSVFLSKLFNGTLFAKHDATGIIIKETVRRFDLRSEFGILVEIGRQSLPVIANECIVRSFYFVRRFALEIKENNLYSLADLKSINWNEVKPQNNRTISQMILIAAGVFSTIDIGVAIKYEKNWVNINYIGVGRFAVAIGEDVTWGLKIRNIKKIKQMYEDIDRFTYTSSDEKIYKRTDFEISVDKLGLTLEQTEILYNLEYYKTLNDIRSTKSPINNVGVKRLKNEWLNEWKDYISKGFSKFLQIEGTEIHWYTKKELIQKIRSNDPDNIWFRLVLLEAMLFEPYYTLGLEKNIKGKDVPSKKYNDLQNIINKYNKDVGDDFLDLFFSKISYVKGYVKRIRKCYEKTIRELSFDRKAVIKSVSIVSIMVTVSVVTAGTATSAIAVALVGSQFAGLSGAALTSACLAYLGGGAIAIGGAGMAGGTLAIVGGGAALGLGAGVGVCATVGSVELLGRKNTILQSAKLLVSVKEIFLNDEQDVVFSKIVCDMYDQNITSIRNYIAELKLEENTRSIKEKKKIKNNIKKAEESNEIMELARNNLRKFINQFEERLNR